MTTNKAPDEFVAAYLECALWASTDDNGDPLDAGRGNDDISTDVMSKAWADCDAFYAANADAIDGEDAKAGHDFWLTRCGHGAGFWDGDWAEPAATRLTDAANAFGNIDLYIGDDGMIYGS